MKYITQLQKKEIDKKYFPNGFLYTIKTFNTKSYSNSKRCDEPFETLQEYERTVKSIRHRNALRFFSHLKNMNEANFIKEINNQFLEYTLENRQHSEFWLSLTYDLVLKGFSVAGKIEDINLRGAFIEWHKLKISELIKQPPQQEIDKPKADIQNIFNFIDFLHSNIDNFNQYNDVKKELNLLGVERSNLEPDTNFKDKLKYNEVQKEIEQKYNVIDKNIIQFIEQKAIEYKVFEFNRTHIFAIKENAESKDVEIILEQRQKYFEFVKNTNSEYYPRFLFSNFNRSMKELFGFFDKSYKNEFKMFESSATTIHSKNQDSDKTKNNQAQPKETNKFSGVKKELHNNIFKGNTFLLWLKFKDNKDISISSRTDLRVIYELMKADNYFQETIELKHYIKFLNDNYFDGSIIELKKQYINNSANIQRSKDYEEYKTNLKLTLK